MSPSSSFPGCAVAVLACLLAIGFGTNAVQAATGSNPIVTDAFTADPAPLVAGNTVYLFTGHDEPNSSFYTMNNWRAYSTPDMTNWTSYGSILSYTNFAWASGSAWAGQCVGPINGKYYWYVPMQGSGSYGGFNIGVAVADNPTGPFHDARGTPLITDGMTTGGDVWDDIDPTVLTDTNGVSWLGWGHGTFYQVQLAASMTNFVGSIQACHLPYYTEGPWLHQRAGIYYLSYASIDTGGEKIRYATGPSVTGPWTPRGLITGYPQNSYTIQDGIIEFAGQSYMFYHNGTLPGGGSFDRSVCLDYLYYNPDGTIQPVYQTTAGVSIPPRKDNFTPGLASRPSPASGATAVSWTPQLGWYSGNNAVAHAVYVGTDSNAVAHADFTAPEYLGTFASSNCVPAALNQQTTYFWRVDEIRGTNVTAGSVWSFTTGSLLAHRYSFVETGGNSVTDSVAGPVGNGTLPNGGTFTGASLALSASAQQYVKLPTGIANSRSGVTFMAWVNLNANANWCRIFDFGNGTSSYLYLTPQNSSSNLQFAITVPGSGGEQTITSSATMSTGVWHQVAVTLSGNTGVPGISGFGGSGALFLDGVDVGFTENLTLNPASLGSTANNYLGKSQYSSDPYLNGSIEEFRIYNGALSPAEIAQAFVAGPAAASSNLPYPWITQDIGAVGLNGSANYSNGAFTISGAGADIQGTADAFRFVCLPVAGDCAIMARVTSQQNVNAWAKAGVMIRESMNTNAANVFMGVTPGNGTTWQSRPANGNTAWNNTTGPSAPCWVMLTRTGNVFTGYRSADGVNWLRQGIATNDMLATVYAGLAVSSHNAASLGSAVFDSVAVPGWTASAPPVVNAKATGTSLTFSWPLTNADFTLQCCTNLAAPVWQMVPSAAPQMTGDYWQVQLSPPTNTTSISYRLRK
jgi:hypothetical protein